LTSGFCFINDKNNWLSLLFFLMTYCFFSAEHRIISTSQHNIIHFWAQYLLYHAPFMFFLKPILPFLAGPVNQSL